MTEPGVERTRGVFDRLYRPAECDREDVAGRLYYWDNLRFLAIALVVVGHFVIAAEFSQGMRAVRIFLYLFHMPLFVFMSGFFSKSFVRSQRFRFERVVAYLLLYVLLKACIFLENRYLLDDPSATFRLFYEAGLPWYMFAMAAWLALGYLARDVRPAIALIGSIVLAILGGYSRDLDSTLVASRIVTFAPFFLLGLNTDRARIMRVLERPWLPLVSVVSLVAIFMGIYVCAPCLSPYLAFFSGLHDYASIGFPAAGGMIRLIVMVAAVIIGFAVMAVVPRCRLPLSSAGARTLQVYFLHRLIYPLFAHYGVGEALRIAFPATWELIVVLLAVLVTFVLSARVFEPPFRWIMGLKLDRWRTI